MTSTPAASTTSATNGATIDGAAVDSVPGEVAPGNPAAAARLSDDQSQAVFRCLLDALSCPGQPASLPVDAGPGLPAALVPALALADVDVTIAVLAEGDTDASDAPHPAAAGAGTEGRKGSNQDSDHWIDLVRTATGALTAPLPEAHFVTALRQPRPDEVTALERGDSYQPELGAWLVVACRRLDVGACPEADPADGGEQVVGDGTGSVAQVQIHGPGVPDEDERTVAIYGIDPEVIVAIDAANQEYPVGIDTWLVADDRRVTGLPRSCRLLVLGDSAKEEG